MKIYKIEFSYQKPSSKIEDMFVNTSYSEPDEGYWIIYSDEEMTSKEVDENLTDENMENYYY